MTIKFNPITIVIINTNSMMKRLMMTMSLSILLNFIDNDIVIAIVIIIMTVSQGEPCSSLKFNLIYHSGSSVVPQCWVR